MNTLLKRSLVTQKKLFTTVTFTLFVFLVSCASLTGPEYYTQLAAGEIQVLSSSTPIQTLLTDKHTPETLKANVRSVLEIREFAVRELGLPESESFTDYVDTGKKFVRWSLVAAPPFSVEPKMWCFPIAGCFSDLAFFRKSLAERFAKKLRDMGYDVSVHGVTSYSTGGFFSDPAMNTLFDLPDYGRASIIFHELAHEKLLIKNDSTFNESFAEFVGEAGQYFWVKKHYGETFAKGFLQKGRRSEEFAKLISTTRDKLKTLYMKDFSSEKILAMKEEIFTVMKDEYAALKKSWGGYDGYDEWMSEPLNNARIAGKNDYGNLVPLFRKLFNFSGRNFHYFYQRVEVLAKMSPAERKREIQKILAL
jgi:predicted aminopeptidase